jgi:ubiquinone/menaquinone biosynthesis C-methylase UbiE
VNRAILKGRSTDVGNDGERLSRSAANSSIVHHLHRYAVALGPCAAKRVADIASGEGYGAHLLAELAEQVTGVDISEQAVRYAANTYQRSNLRFIVGSASQIPLSDASLDVVTSFETIEHHDKHEAMLREFKRILKPKGLLIISSPDKRHYTDLPKFHNPFHVKELYEHEFLELIQAHFKNTRLYGQKLAGGSLVFSKQQGCSSFTVYEGDFDRLNEVSAVSGAQYLICFASDAPLPDISASFFDGELIAEARRQGEAMLHDMAGSLSFRIGRPLRWIYGKLLQ